MISVTGITDRYILQPTLLKKHKETLDWLSASLLWKSEAVIFQKMLDDYGKHFSSMDNKKKLDHFQNLLIYYKGEEIESIRKQLREHESRLAQMLESENEMDTQYYKEHEALMDQVITFSTRFTTFRKEFLEFIQTRTE